ncbi:anti-anti-sigma factor [Nonomuraea solani]|uniref:Anti-sigma factor antagonist n=2 Tax=Nonomuraea solani TaxID=1144553 RepID=A0A1H6DAX7_9ACTN|nr:anti-anti-sigma factor [Nonomuraea solani]
MQLTGDLDVTSTETLHEAIEAVLVGRPSAIEVDMADLRFCDSCGLRALLQAQRRTGGAGAALHLSHVHGPLERVLTITQLDEAFTIDVPPPVS